MDLDFFPLREDTFCWWIKVGGKNSRIGQMHRLHERRCWQWFKMLRYKKKMWNSIPTFYPWDV